MLKHQALRKATFNDEAESALEVTVDPQKPQQCLQIFASLGEVSELFHLTPDQNVAFGLNWTATPRDKPYTTP